MTSGPLVSLVLEGDEAVEVVRALNGATDGRKAAPGTIRGDLSLSNRENLVHGSDSPESAEREIADLVPAARALSPDRLRKSPSSHPSLLSRRACRGIRPSFLSLEVPRPGRPARFSFFPARFPAQRTGRMATNFVGRDMAVDLGTANTLVYVRGRGILVDEPSVVAINEKTGELVAVGHDAKQMVGRTPEDITAIRPLQDGVIADFEATEQMLRHFIALVHRRRYLAKPRMVVCVPSGITAVEQRAVKEAGYQAGARRVYIIEEPMAAAIGAGLPVHQATGNMVVDVGGGTTEVAVISLGGIVTSLSVRTAGDEVDRAITNWMKKEHALLLGEATAEEVKMTLGSAFPGPLDREAEIRGRDLVSGLPRTVTLTQLRRPHRHRGAGARDRRRGPGHPRPDPTRAGRRHHGPRHRAHRRRRAAPRPRRPAPPRDRDAGARGRGPAAVGRARRGPVRGGVRGAPAGAGDRTARDGPDGVIEP